MTYDVLISELTTATGDYDSVADDVGEGVTLTHLTPDSVGHIELAAWVVAVADQCTKATTALHDGVVVLSADLDTAAASYGSTDDNTALQFTIPLLSGPQFGGPSLLPTFPPPGSPGTLLPSATDDATTPGSTP